MNRANRWPASCFAPPAMTTILLDPTLRRARIMRVTVAALTVVAVAALALCAFELRATERPAPALPSPRHAGKTSGRRPYFGRDPVTGRGLAHKPPAAAKMAAAPAHVIGDLVHVEAAHPAEVIAF